MSTESNLPPPAVEVQAGAAPEAVQPVTKDGLLGKLNGVLGFVVEPVDLAMLRELARHATFEERRKAAAKVHTQRIVPQGVVGVMSALQMGMASNEAKEAAKLVEEDVGVLTLTDNFARKAKKLLQKKSKIHLPGMHFGQEPLGTARVESPRVDPLIPHISKALGLPNTAVVTNEAVSVLRRVAALRTFEERKAQALALVAGEKERPSEELLRVISALCQGVSSPKERAAAALVEREMFVTIMTKHFADKAIKAAKSE